MSSLRTWLQLFRAPNLFTVPGDPLAGYLLACYGTVEPRIFLPMAASLCFYAAGLLLNDIADIAEDRVERPNRPLPSGAASLVAVGVAMALLAVGGLVFCFFVNAWTLGVGVALMFAILGYNMGGKRVLISGAINMGLCRGLSLLLGATAVPHGDLSIRLMLHGRLDHLAVAFLLVTFYIAAVTNLARFETKSAAPAIAKWLPAVVVACGSVGFLRLVHGANRNSTVTLFVVAIAIAAQTGWQLASQPQQPLPPAVGKLIGLLLVVQAAFCAAAGGIIGSAAAAFLIILWPVSRAVGKRFYAS